MGFSRLFRRNQRGQASVLIGMMMTTFLLFFAFVVNTGMLVNAKINLQNAADLAAYAGAAVQARQLNHIAYLNYEMRRQFKKFLFRYYVVGNMAQATHPGNPGGSLTGLRQWSPRPGGPNYGVPATCVIFNSQDNPCQVAELGAIRGGNQSFAGDGLWREFRNQLRRLEQIRQDNCGFISATNTQLLIYWLFNTDPTLEEIESLLQNATGPESQRIRDSLAVLRGLASGLGLVPRELLINQRIKTLEEYVNQSPSTATTYGTIQKMQQDADPARHERTIQAFLSAYNTLGGCDEEDGCTFDDSASIELSELLPGGNSGSSLLRLERIHTEFDAYAVNFNLRPGQQNANEYERDCVPFLIPITVRGNIPVGVYKDPTVLTYYALSLRAKAKVMFSPFGEMTLTAFAAAQPFGSRIGPKLTGDSFRIPGAAYGPSCGQIGDVFFNCAQAVPNLPILADDSTRNGWNMNEMIAATSAGLIRPGETALPRSIGSQDLERAYQLAMVPNPWERGRYQIPNDLGGDRFIQHFDSAERSYALWAPIVSPAKPQGGNDLKDLLQGIVQELTASDAQDTTGATQVQWIGAMRDALVNGLEAYMQRLRQGGGENGESFHYARLADPFYSRPGPAGAPQPLTLQPPSLMMRDAEDVRTAWNEVGDPDHRRSGRTGYSVKLVAFKTLLNPSGITTDGQGAVWNNPPPVARDPAWSEALQH